MFACGISFLIPPNFDRHRAARKEAMSVQCWSRTPVRDRCLRSARGARCAAPEWRVIGLRAVVTVANIVQGYVVAVHLRPCELRDVSCQFASLVGLYEAIIGVKRSRRGALGGLVGSDVLFKNAVNFGDGLRIQRESCDCTAQ